MRRPAAWRLVLGALVALGALAALEGSPGAGAVTRGAAAAAGGEEVDFVLPPLLDPSPEALLEIVPRTPSEKLLETAVQSADLCTMLGLRDKLQEPKPDDLTAILDYGNRYFGILKIFAPKAQIDDPRRRGGKITPPQEVIDAIATERAAIYAFHIRVQWAQTLFNDKAFDEAELARRLRYAFTSLAASPFTKAEARLVEAQQFYCPGR